jgi:hypothetical protein
MNFLKKLAPYISKLKYSFQIMDQSFLKTQQNTSLKDSCENISSSSI